MIAQQGLVMTVIPSELWFNNTNKKYTYKETSLTGGFDIKNYDVRAALADDNELDAAIRLVSQRLKDRLGRPEYGGAVQLMDYKSQLDIQNNSKIDNANIGDIFEGEEIAQTTADKTLNTINPDIYVELNFRKEGYTTKVITIGLIAKDASTGAVIGLPAEDMKMEGTEDVDKLIAMAADKHADNFISDIMMTLNDWRANGKPLRMDVVRSKNFKFKFNEKLKEGSPTFSKYFENALYKVCKNHQYTISIRNENTMSFPVIRMPLTFKENDTERNMTMVDFADQLAEKIKEEDRDLLTNLVVKMVPINGLIKVLVTTK
jgi:hypothetical protein